MFISLSITMALRISFPIVLTQMVYVPNIDAESTLSNAELVCPMTPEVIRKAQNSSDTPSFIPVK